MHCRDGRTTRLSVCPCGSLLTEPGTDSALSTGLRLGTRRRATRIPPSWVPGELQDGSRVPKELEVELLTNCNATSLRPETGRTGTIVWKRGSAVLFRGCPRPTLLPGQLGQLLEGTQGS